MGAALLRYHRWRNNFRAACQEACEVVPEPSAMMDYVAMRMAGESRKLAKMLVLRQAPALRTDSEFKKGHVNGNQFESCAVVGDHHRRLAERAGVSTAGKIYVSGLARYPGDPSAWVSGRGDVQRIVEDRGWGASGSVNVARREVEPMPDVQIGQDIVMQEAVAMMKENPGLTKEAALHEAKQIRSGVGCNDPPRVSWPEGEAAEESREIM